MGIQMWRVGNNIKCLSLTAAIIMKTLKHYKKKKKGAWGRHSWGSIPQSRDSSMATLSENYTISLDKKNIVDPSNNIAYITHLLHKCQRKIIASEITKILRDLEKSPE